MRSEGHAAHAGVPEQEAAIMADNYEILAGAVMDPDRSSPVMNYSEASLRELVPPAARRVAV